MSKVAFRKIDNSISKAVEEVMDLLLSLAMPSDLVSLDSCAAQSLGFNPKNINHLCVAQREDVGEMDFELIGDSPLVYHAKPAEKPFSTEVEFFLRKHFPKIFDSFMMDFLAWSAARYYDVWYYSKGRRLLRQFMEESKFAYQWKED